MQYDLLFVGDGLFNAPLVHKAVLAGKKCLVIEKRNHIAENIYTVADLVCISILLWMILLLRLGICGRG